MFEVEFKKSSIIKRLGKIVKNVVPLSYWHCTNSGIKVNSFSNCSNIFLSVHLTLDAFDSYECSRPLTLGINNEALIKFLSCATDSDKVRMKTPNDDPDFIYLLFTSVDCLKKSIYKVKLINLDCETLDIDEASVYDCSLTMETRKFAHLTKGLSSIGNQIVTVYVLDDGMYMETEDSASNKFRMKISESPPNVDFSMMFSIKYLHLTSNCYGLCETVQLCFSKARDTIVVKYSLVDGMGHLKYFIASIL